jgi:predicted tellurium resistance membrane protein TerC
MEPSLVIDAGLALVTLTAMEIVLGIDNIVFVAIVVGKLPKHQQLSARRWGISLALFTRLALLFSITWVMSLSQALFTVMERDVSGRDLILALGGLFLVYKATTEIHEKLESEPHIPGTDGPRVGKAIWMVAIQIAILDIVFSLDSVVTAVGMAQQLWVMSTAIVIAVGIMLLAAGKISDFVDTHPTLKILALSFLLLIGVMLMAEAMGVHVSKGYIYFAMAFSVFVEVLNMRLRKPASPVQLHAPQE